MTQIGVDTLESRINNVIDVHRTAEDVSIAEIIGVLEIVKQDMYQEMIDDDD